MGLRAKPLWLLALLLLVGATADPATAATSSKPAPKSKQHLTVNIGTLPSSLDPGRAKFAEDQLVANALFAPLYRSPGGSGGKLVPHLAAGMPTMSSDGRRYTVRLRTARWSDGKAVRASDVVFAFNRARSRSPYASAFTAVRSVRATGPRTVVFSLSAPVPWFGELLASTVTTPVPAHVVRKYGEKWVQLNRIVVSGPFRLTRARGRSELVLAPNARWWNSRRVRLQELNLLAITHAAASPLFRANRLDIGLRNTSVHPSAVHSWTKVFDPRFRTVTTGEGRYLFLNTRNAALADPRARRAIALAIDRDALAKITAAGVDRPISSIVSDGVRNASLIAPSTTMLLRRDGHPRASEARALLSEAGWDPATKLRLHYDTDGVFDAKVAAAIAKSLHEVDVDVTLHPARTSEFAKVGLAKSPVAATVDMVLLGMVPEYSDPQALHQRFTCAAIDRGANPSNFCSPQFDATYATATSSTGARRLTAHLELEQLLSGPSALMPAVPLYAPAGTMLVQRWVRDFAQHPSGLVDFERIWVTTARP